MKRTRRIEMMIGVAVMLALMLTGKFAVEVKTEAATMTSIGNTLTVTSTADDGSAGTLRWAIANAAAGDTIDFDLSYPATITLTSGQLMINTSLTIKGPGAPLLKVSGNHASWVFQVNQFNPGTIVTLFGLTIADGTDPYTDGIGSGGILNFGGGTLTVTDCVISGNEAQSIDGGGGITNYGGTVTVTGSTFFDNHAIQLKGGAIDNVAGTVKLTNCTIAA